MTFFVLLQTVLLGIVEGLTEFIPVSSTGHLILLIDIMEFSGPPGKVFEIAIQLGAILAVCYAYKDKLWQVTKTYSSNKESRDFVANILVAFMPAAVIGFLAHDFIKEVLFSPVIVCASLITGGAIIIIIDTDNNIEAKYKKVEKLPVRTALYIGFFQCLAMIPGVSRSGATIIGALLLGVSRQAATQFSFFLAIPTMLGATSYDIFKNYENLTMDNITMIAVGFIAAFIAALLVVKTVLEFISRYGFVPFGYYRIILGVFMLMFLFAAP